jgi:hypothetical protein
MRLLVSMKREADPFNQNFAGAERQAGETE